MADENILTRNILNLILDLNKSSYIEYNKLCTKQFFYQKKKNLFEKKSTCKISTCFHILNKIIKFSYNRIIKH